MQQGSKTAVPRRTSREQARGIRVILFCSSSLEALALAEDCAIQANTGLVLLDEAEEQRRLAKAAEALERWEKANRLIQL